MSVGVVVVVIKELQMIPAYVTTLAVLSDEQRKYHFGSWYPVSANVHLLKNHSACRIKVTTILSDPSLDVVWVHEFYHITDMTSFMYVSCCIGSLHESV